MATLREIRDRKLMQWAAGYVAVAWGLLQFLWLLAGTYNWPPLAMQIVINVEGIGFAIALVLAWYHGERSQKHLSRTELLLLTVVVVFGVGLLWHTVHAPQPVRGSPAAVASALTPIPSIEKDPSIAVLPLVNMSDDKNNEYFSDGISEELLNLLTKVPQLRVIARTSSFSFKGKVIDIAEIARKLNVAAILEGSVRKSGTTVRITVQLVRASDSSHLWSETYDRALDDIFKVQDEIAGAVVSALKLKLLPDQRPISIRRFVPSSEAYDKYLLGRQFANRNTQAGFESAIGLYHQAVALQPNYADAYAALSLAEKSASFLAVRLTDFARGQQRALAAAERAIATDPMLADGYAARGAVRIESWDWAGAQADLDKARALNPKSVSTYACAACFFATQGRLPEAIVAVRAALVLNPLSIEEWIKLARYEIEIGDLGAARKALLRALTIAPKPGGLISYYHGLVSLIEGHPDAASVEGASLVDEPSRLELVAVAEYDLSHVVAAQQALDALIVKCSQDAPYRIAEVYAWRGENDRAVMWLERAYTKHDRFLRFLKFSPLLRKLRDDPRYSALLRKMGLPE